MAINNYNKMLDRNLTIGDVVFVSAIACITWLAYVLYESLSVGYRTWLLQINEIHAQLYELSTNVKDIVYMIRDLIGDNMTYQDDMISNVVPSIVKWLRDQNLDKRCQYSKCGISSEFPDVKYNDTDILTSLGVKSEDKKNENIKNENKKNKDIQKEINVSQTQNIAKDKNNDDIKSNIVEKKPEKKSENIKVI